MRLHVNRVKRRDILFIVDDIGALMYSAGKAFEASEPEKLFLLMADINAKKTQLRCMLDDVEE